MMVLACTVQTETTTDFCGNIQQTRRRFNASYLFFFFGRF